MNVVIPMMKDPSNNLSEPSVSVIIPTYNRQHMVDRALGSVLNQTYRDVEVIVVDDCSSDDTEQVIARIDDTRIRYMRHEINRGAPAARNSGFAAARGMYVAFLDSDDEWLPEKLEKQLNLFHIAPDTVGVVYAGFSYVYEKTGEIISEIIPTLRGCVYEEMLRSCIIGSPTPLIKRDRINAFHEPPAV
jgi:glycosyltransferase involved in cell wall biosynthesis